MQYVAMLFLVTTLLGAAGTGWYKLQLAEAELEVQVLTTERDAALASLRAAEQRLKLQEAQVQEAREKMAELAAEAAQARKQVQYTQRLFNDHDLGDLMAKKPGLITNRMQKASDQVLLDLQSVTE